MIEFIELQKIDPNDMLGVVNQKSLRTHLVTHPLFDETSIRTWMNEKTEIGMKKGCRIRAVNVDGELAGWCGIQPDDEGFELAIVISKEHWGQGVPIFKKMICWANELGHDEVKFHLLDSRREYRALSKLAKTVQSTELLGRRFTTYSFLVKELQYYL